MFSRPIHVSSFLIILFIFSACTKQSADTQAVYPLYPFSPKIYARYENIQPLLKNNLSHCNDAFGYQRSDPYPLSQHSDLCAPKPQKKSFPSNKPWQVPNGVSTFHWEHKNPKATRIQLEILDDEGIPWPSKLETRNQKGRFLMSIRPKKKLPTQKLFFLVAGVYTDTNKKLASWSMPIKIIN